MSTMRSLQIRWFSRLLLTFLLISLALGWFTNVPASNAAVPAQFIRHAIDAEYAYADDIQLADMDGDNDLDVIAATPVAVFSSISWWENEAGDGTSWFEHIVSAGDSYGYTAVPSDLDGDDDLDILASVGLEDDIVWFENMDGSATTWAKHPILAHEMDLDLLLAADVDGDDDLDIVAGLAYNDEIAWWENLVGNASSWARHEVAQGPHFPNALAVADIDDDGDLDLLSGTYYDGEIAWWENLDGNGRSWLMHLVASGYSQPYTVGAADMDNDGALDIYSAVFGGDKIVWWRNVDGKGLVWESHVVVEGYGRPRDVLAVDIDADHDMDLVNVSLDSTQVTLWENIHGTGITWYATALDNNFPGGTAITAGDIDGDNDMDVVAASYNDTGLGDNIAWWEQETAAFVVNSTDDSADAQPGDGLCDDGTGHCTLRAALMEANVASQTQHIHFHIPGAGPHIIQPQSPLPLIEKAMVIDGYSQPGARLNTNPAPLGLNTQLMVGLDGSMTSGSIAFGFSQEPWPSIDGLVIRGLAIYNFGAAIGGGYEEGYDVIGARFVGNFIGTDVTGTIASGSWSGVTFSGHRFKNIDIGGIYPEDRNLIKGVSISSRYPESIRIQGNLIGTDISGLRPLGNGTGIDVSNASDILIGGAESGAANVISGNISPGIRLDGNDGITTIQGNLIGMAADGHTPLGNDGDGINNFEHASVKIENNYIVHNQGNGLTIGLYSNSTLVSANVISGNNGDGINLVGSNNYTTIQNNLIGLAPDGQTPLGNEGSGIYAAEHKSMIVDENQIAYNQGNGLTILRGNAYQTSYFTTYAPNAVFRNGGLGIDLLNDGVTLNDPLDVDTGPNDLQNYPVLESVVHSNGTVTVSGSLSSRPDRTYKLWFFTNEQCDPSGYGEGESFAQEMVVTTDGGGYAAFTIVFPQQERPFVTATASYYGAISEFSQCRADPLHLVTLLQAQVQQLIDEGNLTGLAGARLLAKLDNVAGALQAGQENTAVLRLRDFIASVNTLMNRRHLDRDLGRPLVDAAWAIIQQINLP
jgi:CSLREA domain-containing protein